jgi:hypothetical protein
VAAILRHLLIDVPINRGSINQASEFLQHASRSSEREPGEDRAHCEHKQNGSEAPGDLGADRSIGEKR